jgi:hypothetical protein
VHLTELAAVPNGAYGEGASITGVRAVDLGVNGTLPPRDDSLPSGPEGDMTAAGDPDDKLQPCPNCGYTAEVGRERIIIARRALLSLPPILPI